jgi:hypothetical protein
MASSTFYITHRRTQASPGGTHVHVARVLLSGGTQLSRDEVFAWMRNGNKFKTLAPNSASADVVRVACGRCSSDYLRTTRDMTKADNLDELPKF